MSMEDFATKLNDRTIQFVRILPGPIEKIWEYLADSDKRGEWFAKGAFGKVGEPFELRWKHSELSPNQATPPERMAEMDKNGHSATNILLKWEPPHLLVFTFGTEKLPPGERSEVEFRLAQEGDIKDNKVRFTLTHSKIPDRAYAVNVSGGWHAHLDVLQYRAEGKVPPAFWDVWRKTEDTYEKRYA
jgi:uncharacterized protein YndB with AHSA1/START domain